MTNREFFVAIANDTAISEELRSFAKESIEKLNARNAARAAKPSKAAVANDALAAEMLPKFAVGSIYTASDLAEMMDFKTEAGAPSTSKATAVVKVLVEMGKVKSEDIKVPKKGKCKGYSLVVEGEDE